MIRIPREKVKVANNVMICHCSICEKRIRPQETYLDEDYFGWNTTVHVECWLNWKPSENSESANTNLR